MAVGYIVAISVLAIIVIILGAVLAYVQLQRDNDEDPQDPKVVIPDIKGMVKEAIAKHLPAKKEDPNKEAAHILGPAWIKNEPKFKRGAAAKAEQELLGRSSPGWMRSKEVQDAQGLTGKTPAMYGKHFSAGSEGGGNEPGMSLAGLKEDDPKNFSAEDAIMARLFTAHGGG